MTLRRYNAKRDFARTAEPKGERTDASGARFVVQQHAARRMHFDFRLELDGVLKSWAVPKGPSLRTDDRRLAVQVEDHPVAYAGFEGVIPAGAYGGGQVIVWDEGTWHCAGDARDGLRRGRLTFTLHGHKLGGAWRLVRTGGREETSWLLCKLDDPFAREAGDVTVDAPLSLRSGRRVHEVDGPPPVAGREGRKAGRTRSRSATATWPGTATFGVQLATAAEAVPATGRWLYEVKLDGYRALLVRNGAQLQLRTRNGHDWTARFPSLLAALQRLPVDQVVLDGEVVALDARGGSDFSALQRALADGDDGQLLFCAFDLLWLQGTDWRPQPQTARKRALARLFAAKATSSPLRYWAHVTGAAAGRRALAAAEAAGLEGLLAKRADAGYGAGRSDAWRKLKCVQREEFVVGGYTGDDAARPRALLLGAYDDARLRYVGRVASGLDRRLAQQLAPALQHLAVRRSAFADAPAGEAGVHYVRPELVVEVRFGAWSAQRRLRHAAVLGLRRDKDATDVVDPSAKRPVAAALLASPVVARPLKEAVVLSNPKRRVAPNSWVTKAELAAYLEEVASVMLPWVGNRPLSVLRCPEGDLARAFFHKHLDASLPGLVPVAIDAQDYAGVRSAAGLRALVQLSALELHPWGSRVADVEAMDTLVFDLDPGEGVAASQVVEAALQVRAVLKTLALKSVLKATGGKGLHVVVPGIVACTWPEAKAFSALVADYLVASEPARYTASVRKAARRGKIFVDYLRNGRGATAIGAYSTRARAGLPLARPVAWDELTARTVTHPWDVPKMRRALRADYTCPWRAARRWKQSLSALSRAQALEHARTRGD